MKMAESSAARELDNLTEYRVLVAEDDAVCQDIVLLMLERLGCHGDVVADGAAAVTAVNAGSYDLVLMDVQMPRMNGMEATRLIRDALDATDQPTIIAMTADTSSRSREECLGTGMDGCLDKPVRMEELASVLEHGTSRHPKLDLVDPGGPTDGVAPGELITVVFDSDILESLVRDLGGDDAVRDELITSFVVDADERVTRILPAGEGCSLESLAFEAHALKSASAVLGLLALSEVAADVEAAAGLPPLDVDVSALASRLAAECRRAVDALNTPGG